MSSDVRQPATAELQAVYMVLYPPQEETVRLARELRPDILLLDISMPSLNGVEVARVLETALPKTRIVVLTGYSDSEEYARALLRLGVKGYLSKTASVEEVIDALRSVHAGHTHIWPHPKGLARRASGGCSIPSSRPLRKPNSPTTRDA